jgi:endoglucanase
LSFILLAWISSGNGAAFTGLSDPNKNIAIGESFDPPPDLFNLQAPVLDLEMHQYLDSDHSGTSPTCVSATAGAERIAEATAWLKQYGFKGFLGEIGAGSNGV